MQFLAILKRNSDRFTDADFQPFLGHEVEKARALYVEGFIRQIWHRGDVGGACMLIEAESEELVRNTLGTLPLVAADMLDIVSVIPLKPYGGFGPRAG